MRESEDLGKGKGREGAGGGVGCGGSLGCREIFGGQHQNSPGKRDHGISACRSNFPSR